MRYDLTDIPSGYDRGRDHGPEVLNLWLDAVERRTRVDQPKLILDLGCGTGRFTSGLARRFNAEVIGLDPSTAMLEIAKTKAPDPRVRFWLGDAETIPLPSRSCDLIFISMAYHHFNDRLRALRECARVLRPRGRVALRTGTRERIDWYPYVPFFPDSRAILQRMLPSLDDLRLAFDAAGFTQASAEVIEQVIARDWPTYAEKLASGGDSVIAQLSPKLLEEGLSRVREHRPKGEQTVREPIDFLVYQLTKYTPRRNLSAPRP